MDGDDASKSRSRRWRSRQFLDTAAALGSGRSSRKSKAAVTPLDEGQATSTRDATTGRMPGVPSSSASLYSIQSPKRRSRRASTVASSTTSTKRSTLAKLPGLSLAIGRRSTNRSTDSRVDMTPSARARRRWRLLKHSVRTAKLMQLAAEKRQEERTVLGQVVSDSVPIMAEDELLSPRQRLLRPGGLVQEAWNALVALTVATAALYVPVVFGFPGDGLEKPTWLFAVFIDTIFVLDMVVQFLSPFYDEDGTLQTEYSAIAKRYLRSWFVVDVLALLPLSYIFMALVEEDAPPEALGRTIAAAALLRTLRLLKLLRIHRMTGFVRRLESLLHVEAAWARLGRTFFFIMLAAHLVACMWHLVAFLENSPTGCVRRPPRPRVRPHPAPRAQMDGPRRHRGRERAGPLRDGAVLLRHNPVHRRVRRHQRVHHGRAHHCHRAAAHRRIVVRRGRVHHVRPVPRPGPAGGVQARQGGAAQRVHRRCAGLRTAVAAAGSRARRRPEQSSRFPSSSLPSCARTTTRRSPTQSTR